MKRLACCLFVLCCSSVVFPQQRDWLKNSDLVFQGNVLKLNTSTVDLPDASDLGLVRVTDIIEGDALLRNYLQQPITVRFRDIKVVKPGQTAIFFARYWISGRGLAVQEVGMKPSDNPTDLGRQKEDIRRDRAKLDEDSLRDKLRAADHVVVGRVLSIKRLPENPKIESEHDPMWMEAEIGVDEGLKGSFKRGDRVKVTFAASNDIMWVKAPRLTRGQSAIFVLTRKTEAVDVPNFVLLDRDQVLDVKRRDEIRKLL
jgi:hypothetical protein